MLVMCTSEVLVFDFQAKQFLRISTWLSLVETNDFSYAEDDSEVSFSLSTDLEQLRTQISQFVAFCRTGSVQQAAAAAQQSAASTDPDSDVSAAQ